MHRTTAIAMAVVMMLSGFTIVSAASDDYDAASVADFEVGDAWGAGSHVSLEDVLKELGTQHPEYNLPASEAELLEYLSDNPALELLGYDLQVTHVGFDGDIWAINEIVEENSSGYVMDLNGVVSLKLEVSFTLEGMLPTNVDDLEDMIVPQFLEGDDDDDDVPSGFERSKLVVENLGMTINLTVNGSAYFDREFDLTRSDVTVQAYVMSNVSSNVSIDGEGNISYGDKVAETKVSAAMNVNTNITFIDEPLQILPREDGKGWTQETEVNVTVVGNVNTDVPFLDDDMSEGINESENMDIYTKVSVDRDGDGVYTMTLFSDIEEMEKPLSYKYPFEFNEISEYKLIGDSLKLDDNGKKIARDKIESLGGDIGQVTENMVLTVQFMDDDDNILPELTQKVKYGEKMRLPGYPEGAPHDSDEVFIGWESPNDKIWKEEWPVTSSMIMEPEFADVVDTMPGTSDFENRDTVKWDSDIDDIVDKIVDNDIFSGNNTLYITVAGEDGKLLYQWRISSTAMEELNPSTVIKPEIVKVDTPDRAYLAEAAAGNGTMYLDFRASGTMPANTVVSYYVGDTFSDGEKITIYYDNETKGTAENSGTSVVIDGYVDIPLKHCSSYMLVSSGQTADETSTMTMLGIAFAVLMIVVAVAAFVIFRKSKSA